MAGYSSTPLEKKLGLKTGLVISFREIPPEVFQLLSIPEGIKLVKRITVPCDYIHVFAKSYVRMQELVLNAKEQIKEDGMIWVSWPKKSSGVKTDISEDQVRNFAVAHGLVDIKVCAINEVWSALKLVIPVKHRAQKKKQR